MASQDARKIEAYKEETRQKIESLLEEFAQGKINREQFNAVYAHHNAKLRLADEALHQNDAALVQGRQGETVGIRQAYMGKAIGFLIYHNKSGMFVDTLGMFDIPPSRIAPILNDFSTLMQGSSLIDRRVEHFSEKHWLLFAAGKYTTVVTLFEHEPSAMQSREIERLHHDFETANQHQLTNSRVDASKLAYPFLVFIQQKLRKG